MQASVNLANPGLLEIQLVRELGAGHDGNAKEFEPGHLCSRHSKMALVTSLAQGAMRAEAASSSVQISEQNSDSLPDGASVSFAEKSASSVGDTRANFGEI